MSNLIKFPNIKAHEKWNSIPSHQQQKILENVWCTRCSSVTKVIQPVFDQIDQDLLIKGNCAKCNGEVARLVEMS